jgi:hypothetical protein
MLISGCPAMGTVIVIMIVNLLQVCIVMKLLLLQLMCRINLGFMLSLLTCPESHLSGVSLVRGLRYHLSGVSLVRGVIWMFIN